MTAITLDGAKVAEDIRTNLASQIDQMVKDQGVRPGLGTILVGDDPASHTYVNSKLKVSEEIGIKSVGTHLSARTTQDELYEVIDSMNENPEIDSILLQLPLPDGLDEEAALLRVNASKDVDGLHPVNLGKLVMGAPGPLPCTPAGIQELLGRYDVPIAGKHVVVIGRGLTIGRPLALLLALKREHANAAVTVIHTGVPNMGDYTRQADVIVSAAGVPGLVKPDMVREGAAVVGGGITRRGKRILSDIDEEVVNVAGWMTPRIGGVGPMTIAMLLSNTVAAAKKRNS